MTIWGCENSVTPEPIDFKFRLYVYVGDYTSCAKFRKIRLGGASRKYDEIYTLHARNFYFFIARQHAKLQILFCHRTRYKT